MNEKYDDQDSVTITGSGKISGGVYDKIKIMGSARVTGDIEANTVQTAGSATFSGSVNALNVQTAGSCRVGEDVNASQFKTAGSCTVEGDVRATDFACSGSQRVGGDLIAGQVKISGSCKVGNDVEADHFYSKGRFDIGGLLTADEIRVELAGYFAGPCRANEIGGERIWVRNKGKTWEWNDDDFERKVGKVGYKLEKGLTKLRDRFGIEIELGDVDKFVKDIVRIGEEFRMNIEGNDANCSMVLEARLIEGDEVYLENTHAKVVRGKDVTIGPGCQIGRVEYSGKLEVDELAEVDEQERI